MTSNSFKNTTLELFSGILFVSIGSVLQDTSSFMNMSAGGLAVALLSFMP